MRLLAISLFIILFLAGNAQVTIVLDSVPASTDDDAGIYIVGDFQGWDPASPQSQLEMGRDGRWTISLEPNPPGTVIEFKFTQGSWSRVEKGIDLEEIQNRTFTFGNGDTLLAKVYNWADEPTEAQNTTSENIQLVDEDFYIPQLDRHRRIWIYLPPDYQTSGKDYPVLYMHDGQNLFDRATSYSGEWEVDESLDRLFLLGYQVPVVVGVDNGGAHRTDEMMPWTNSKYGGGQAEAYLSFIVETLKPFIDENYRTLPGREYTGIAGSSLGGLVSLYAALKYQEVFSKCGSISPAYWVVTDSLDLYMDQIRKSESIRFYQSMGDGEGDEYISHMYAVEEKLKGLGFSDVATKVIVGGEHSEFWWQQDFENVFLWLYASYANNLKESVNPLPLFINYEPDKESIQLTNFELNIDDRITIYDENGKLVQKLKIIDPASPLKINGFVEGRYLLILKRKKIEYRGRFFIGC